MKACFGHLFEPPAIGRWECDVMDRLTARLRSHPFWEQYLQSHRDRPGFSVHLVVLQDPYLNLIVQGRKTMEARLSSIRRIPFERVAAGDVLLLKRVSSSIEGISRVAEAHYHEFGHGGLEELRQRHDRELAIQHPLFWAQHGEARFATLLQLDHPQVLAPIRCFKKDRRAWAIVWPPPRQV